MGSAIYRLKEVSRDPCPVCRLGSAGGAPCEYAAGRQQALCALTSCGATESFCLLVFKLFSFFFHSFFSFFFFKIGEFLVSREDLGPQGRMVGGRHSKSPHQARLFRVTWRGISLASQDSEKLVKTSGTY